MRHLLFLLPLLALASCATTHKAAMLPIPSALPVTPSVAAIRPALDKAGNLGSSLQTGNASLQRQVQNARDEAADAAKESRRLAQKGEATKAELDQQATSNEQLEKHVAALQTEVTEQSGVIHEQLDAIEQARVAQAEALEKASKIDATADLLTQQVKAVSGQYQASEAAREKAETSLASALVYKHWVMTGLTIIGIYFALRLLKLTPWGKAFLFWIP